MEWKIFLPRDNFFLFASSIIRDMFSISLLCFNLIERIIGSEELKLGYYSVESRIDLYYIQSK